MSASRTIPVSQSPDLVTYSLLVDGTEVPLSVPVISIKVVKEVNKIPFAKLEIQDGDPSVEDFLVSNGDQFIPGKEMEIKLGYHNDNQTVFKGIITSHSNKISNSGKSSLIIECKDKSVKMTIGRKNKHFNEVTDSDVAEEIIAKYKLESSVSSTSIKHKDLVQFDTCDWDFLLTRMDRIGYVCVVDDGKVSFKKPDLSSSSVLDVLFGATIIEYEAVTDARDQWQTVTAHSWDYSQQSTLEATANEPSIGEENGDLSATTLSDVIGLDDYKLIHTGKLSSEELQAWADAKMQKQRLAKTRGKVKFMGYSTIKPDMYLKLNGVGSRFNGPVYVGSVTQEYHTGTWNTEISFGMSPEWYSESKAQSNSNHMLGMMPTIQGLVIGIVTDLEDPEGEHRVKVKIPVVSNDEEGVWARIASLDAGSGRGMFFRPEIGDEVIIGTLNQDSSQLVILGMLNSSQLAAPLSAANANDEKGYVSRAQMKWIFNDKDKSIKIETPGGKKITLSDKDKVILIEDENSNKITMNSSGITVEAASTLTLKGGSSVKIEAPSISIEGSGTTNIKGGMVNIN